MVTTGLVSGEARWGSRTSGTDYIITDMDTAAGSSGGPVFNLKGEVVGFVDIQETGGFA